MPSILAASRAMYPTINLVGDNTFNPLHAPYPSPGSSSATPPQPPAAPQPARANGPPGPPPPSFPTLRVTIDPKFCLAPPVKAPSQPPGEGGPAGSAAAPPPPPGLPVPGSSQPLDLELERKLMADLKASGSSSSSAGGSGAGASGAGQDPYETLLRRFTDMGFTRDEVAMGLAIAGPDAADDSDRIVESCRKFQRLASMGFKSQQIVGALLLANGDETAATETCLDASAS